MSEVRPRVTGTEMEWAVGLRSVGSAFFRQAGHYELTRLVAEIENSKSMSRKGFMTNGSRCYKDGDYLEYATGEEDTFIGTVASEIAGEQLVTEAAQKYITMFNPSHLKVDNVELLKRVYFSHKVTSGYHVNLCGDATRFNLTKNDLYDLGLWAATASMYIGAGCLYEDRMEGPLRPAIAQKTTEVTSGFSESTTNTKPLICMRNQPHGDPERFHRVQIVGIDANISPWASWMALGTASLCLRAIEQNRRTSLRLRGDNDYNSASPLAVLAREVAFNTDLDARAFTEDGRLLTALQIQTELYTAAEKTEHTEEEARVLENWAAILGDIEGDRSMLKQKVGWVARLNYLQRYAERRDLSITDSSLTSTDRAWDRIGEGSVAEKLRSIRWRDDMPDAQLIDDRRTKPCPTTRATLRVDALKESEKYRTIGIDWDYYKFNNKLVRLSDPLMTDPPIDEDDLDVSA